MSDKTNGHWITYNGRKIFISDDPAEKQSREIAESQKRVDKYNKSRQEKSDPIESNPYYRGLAEKAKKVLSAKDSDFESLNDKYTDLYELAGDFAKYGLDGGDTYNAVQDEIRRIEKVIGDEYVQTGRYSEEVKKYANKKVSDAKTKQDAEESRKAKIARLEKENSNSYVTPYGGVMTAVRKGNKSTDSYISDYKKAFDKEGIAYFIDPQASNKEDIFGIIGTYKDWDGAKPTQPDWFEWGWFTDEKGKKKLYFYEPD